jgi:hypothetical protein
MDCSNYLANIKRLLRVYPVVGILSARQIGKTPLAGEIVNGQRQSDIAVPKLAIAGGTDSILRTPRSLIEEVTL